MALSQIGIAPPFRWPSALEKLVKEGDYFLEHSGNINRKAGEAEKFYTQKKIEMARVAHKYYRLLEYIEQGYAPREGEGGAEKRHKHDIYQECLYSSYACIIALGKIPLGRDTIRFCPQLKLPGVKSDQDFQKYLGEVKSCWASIQRVEEEDEGKVELAKHFNRVTELIDETYSGDERSLCFNAQEDKWERGRDPFHYGRTLHEEHFGGITLKRT